MSPRHLASHLAAVAADGLPSGADTASAARRLHSATGFTARTFWQHNGGTAEVDNAWTCEFLRSRGFSPDKELEIDWSRLVGQAVAAILVGDNEKG